MWIDFISDLRLHDGSDQLWLVIYGYTYMSHLIVVKQDSKIEYYLGKIFGKNMWMLLRLSLILFQPDNHCIHRYCRNPSIQLSELVYEYRWQSICNQIANRTTLVSQ
jgi:hypothetical protein